MLAKLSEGTRHGHEGGWRQWSAYRSARGRAPFLQGRDRAERLEDEDALIDYAAILGAVLKRTEGAIKQKLFAVRYARLIAGYGDPLLREPHGGVHFAGAETEPGNGHKEGAVRSAERVLRELGVAWS